MTAPRASEGARSGAALRYVGVEKRYGGLVALRATSFEIASGEFFAILGPSGSGKSTLLGVTAGFVAPSAGQVFVDGVDLVTVAPYRRNIGMVFQNYSLFPHMTVTENIAFPLRMRRMAAAEIERRVKRMLEMVRLAVFAERRPSQLSGGQQQRVALARAAVYDPLLLLMDEPLGALDKNLREEMQDEIKRFQLALGTTVLYVTHDQQEAAYMADRIAIMRAGALVQIGTPRQLYEEPVNRFVASFLGEANIFPVVALEAGTALEGAAPDRAALTARTAEGLTLEATGPAPREGAAVICVRPESVALDGDLSRCENRFAATVSEAVYTAGSIRYRVTLPGGAVLTLRLPSHHGIRLYAPGDTVRVGWRTADARLIAEG